jgi:hypothetical protein
LICLLVAKFDNINRRYYYEVFTLQEFEKAVDTITNQIIFVNSLGQWEYHPEREDFLYRYYYAKYILKAEF